MAAQRDVLSARARDIARLGLEADGVTWAQQRIYASEWFPDAELVPTEGLVDRERQVKDEGEVARIGLAASIADEALAAILPMLGDRPTEQAFALELDTEIRRRGADGNSFETIVGSGPNGAKPHARPSEPRRRARRPGRDRLRRDGRRLLLRHDPHVLGRRAFDLHRQRMLEVVGAAQRAGVATVAAGVGVRYGRRGRRGRDRPRPAGATAFTHRTGHGVGLEIHEHPRVASTVDHTLVAGNVVTVEPGVYLPEHGGVRIEDTVLVTSDGCQPLTHAPKLCVI